MNDLPITRNVNVTITSSPLAARRVGFGVLNIITKESGAITRPERFRTYTSTTSVAEDFDTSTKVYKGAQTYFAQQPQPETLMISMRYETDQPAEILGGADTFTVDEFTSITTGAFDVTINGTNTEVTGLDFSAAATLDDVATVIATGLGDDAGCTFEENKFVIRTTASGAANTLTFLREPSTGTDISELLKMRSAEDGALMSQGLAGETITDSLEAIQDKAGNAFYGFQFTNEVRDGVLVNGEEAVLAAADWSESQVKIFFNTTNDLNVLNRAVTTDICSKLKAKSLRRTGSTFSSYPSQYPSSSVAGRAFTWDTNVPDSHYSLMFKQMPTITVEALTGNEANTLDEKACNYVAPTAGTIFYQTGQMANGVFLDEVHGLDALESDLEVAVFNLLFQSTTKVPYTNEGVQQVIAEMRGVLDQYVRNGFLAAGYIDDGKGGQKYLKDGYEISFVPVEKVQSADRDMRKYSGISFVCIGAGALHNITITGTFKR